MRVRSRLLCGLLFAALVVCASGCQEQINFPAPVLLSINPTSTQAGHSAFNLTASGKGFTPSSTIFWNGAAQITTYDSATGDLVAQVPASEVAAPGQAYISVETPQPGGGITASLQFLINPNPSAVPHITGLTPTSAAAGSAETMVTITGQNFVPQSAVYVNGAAATLASIPTTTTAIQFDLSADELAAAGTLQISVFNPPPDGGSSNTFGFNVNNPVPSLASLSPATTLAGSASASLAVTGANFVSTSTILIDGAPRTTAYAGATQLTATLSAGDLTQSGIALVQVENPGPGGGASNVLTFAVDPTDQFGLPDLVDYGYDGTQANNGICGSVSACAASAPSLATAGPSVNTTGQYVAFASSSTNLLQNQSNAGSAIFLRDTCLSGTTTSSGSSSCTPTTTLVDLGINGAVPNGPADEPSLDSAGTHVAYTSTATNLESYAPTDGTTQQVYWQPTCTGGSGSAGCAATGSTGTAALVSVAPDGLTSGNGDSYDPVISPDGQYVAFVSLATNLVSGVTVDGVTPQIYVRSTCSVVPPSAGSGCTPVTYLASAANGSPTPVPGDGQSSHPAISNDGLFVSFSSTAKNLVGSGGADNPEFSGNPEIFERSTCLTTLATAGGTCVPGTTLISSPDGVTPGNQTSDESSLSQDGRFVAFASSATNLISGIGPTQQVYVADTCTGVAVTSPPQCIPALSLVSSPDGVTPANATAESPSVNSCITSTSVTISCGTGQFIAFASNATNLGPSVQNGVENIFVRNTCEGVTATTTTTSGPDCAKYTFLASQPQGAGALPANGDSIVPTLSGDGHIVGFLSSAGNLVPNDTNGIPDAFISGAAPSVNLAVSLVGTGSGTVTDSQSRISCTLTTGAQTGTCSAGYLYGSSVTLTATAASGHAFEGWGGDVSSTTCPATTTSCTVTMIVASQIAASFK